jgi:2-C-methyl-D-erythritol 4-phosphate cytidylyltransferase
VAREGLWAVQTPQAFAADVLRRAHSPSNKLLQATDCAGLVEAAGGRVKVVDGDPRLLKVTSEADLATVAGWR